MKYIIKHFISENEIVSIVEISEDSVVAYFEQSFLWYQNEYGYQGSTCTKEIK
jgi:hypothetical protein